MKKLKEQPLNLSPLQDKILLAMPFGVEILSTDLVDIVYAGNDRPFDARGQLFSGMNVLIKKLDHANYKWRITKGPRMGPRPFTFKLEKRK